MGGGDKLRQEVLSEIMNVEQQLGLQITINTTTVDRFGQYSIAHYLYSTHHYCAYLIADGCRSTTTIIPSQSGNRNLTITLTWPETNLAELAVVTCPCGTLDISAQVATRYCGGNFVTGAVWSSYDPNTSPCNLSDNARKICQLSLVR